MQAFLKIPIYISIVVFLFGCSKDKVENPIVIKNHLKLDPIKKAYYNANNDRYETDKFSTNENAFNYTLETTSGNKYRVLMYGIPMSDVTIQLRDAQQNVIQSGEQANVGYTAKYFVFETSSNVDYHIHIETTNSAVYNQNFYLTFEEVGTYRLQWKGKNWICDGDWEINDNDQLIHIGHNSGFSKWAKISNESFNNCNINLEFQVPATGLNNYLGVSVNSGDNIFDMINLPSVGRQFKLSGLNQYAFWWINIGNNGGIANETGYLSQPLEDGLNQLKCSIQSDSLRYFVNGTFETAKFNDLYGSHRVYLTVEDFGTDSLTLNDFIIN